MTEPDAVIDTWLMSCRVLGRQSRRSLPERVGGAGRAVGSWRLIGEYYPTAKNAMVCDLYPRLGFALEGGAADGGVRFSLDLDSFARLPVLVTIHEAIHAGI